MQPLHVPQTWVTWLWGGVTHLVGNEQLWYRARIRAVGVTLAGFFCQTKGATRIFQQKVQYGVRNMLIQSMIWYSCPFFPCFFVSYVFQFPGLENTTLKRCWKTPLLEFGTSSDHTLNISLIEEPTKDFLNWGWWIIFFTSSRFSYQKLDICTEATGRINDKCWVLICFF